MKLDQVLAVLAQVAAGMSVKAPVAGAEAVPGAAEADVGPKLELTIELDVVEE